MIDIKASNRALQIGTQYRSFDAEIYVSQQSLIPSNSPLLKGGACQRTHYRFGHDAAIRLVETCDQCWLQLKTLFQTHAIQSARETPPQHRVAGGCPDKPK